MTTSPLNVSRNARRGALALIVTAAMAPASPALAQGDTPADYPGMPGSQQTAPPVGDTPSDYPGMSGSSQTPPPIGDTPVDYPGMPGSPPAVAFSAAQASGFDWTSAGIGAGAAGVLIVVSLGGAAAVSGLRFRQVRS